MVYYLKTTISIIYPRDEGLYIFAVILFFAILFYFYFFIIIFFLLCKKVRDYVPLGGNIAGPDYIPKRPQELNFEGPEMQK